jgi:hypothetical protein
VKRIVWAALLVLASGQAAADWVNIGSDANAELFVDRSTIARSGDMVTMWSVSDLKMPHSANGATYLSLKRQDEFDCAASRVRGLQISAHPQALGEGQAVASEKGSGAWMPVTPESIGEKLWKVACGKE